MKKIGIIGGGSGIRGALLMYTSLAVMSSKMETPIIYKPVVKNKTSKVPEYISKFGNGKKKFLFETEYCQVEIWADNPKSANKKLSTVNGVNSEIKWKRKRAGLQ